MPDGATVADVRDAADRPATRAPCRGAGRGRAVRRALDQVLCDERPVVRDGAELAFFPPVTGG